MTQNKALNALPQVVICLNYTNGGTSFRSHPLMEIQIFNPPPNPDRIVGAILEIKITVKEVAYNLADTIATVAVVRRLCSTSAMQPIRKVIEQPFDVFHVKCPDKLLYEISRTDLPVPTIISPRIQVGRLAKQVQ